MVEAKFKGHTSDFANFYRNAQNCLVTKSYTTDEIKTTFSRDNCLMKATIK